MAKFIRVAAAAWRKFIRCVQERGEVDFKGIGIPLLVSDEPIETRAGYNLRDKAPCYESDAEKLLTWYRGYRTTYEARNSILYADVYALKFDDFTTIPASRTLDFKSLEVQIDGVKWQVPSRLRPHADLAVTLFKERELIGKVEGTDVWENNDALRLEHIDSTGVIKARAANYFQQVGTNITLDWKSGKLPNPSTTIRNSEERPVDHKLPSLESSSLANTLGVAVVFFNQQLEPDIRLRSEDLASIQKEGLHCTASGVWELPPDFAPGTFSGEYLEYGAHKEIKDEVGLMPNEYALFPIAIARELPRGGKPQIFFVAISLVSEERYQEAKRNARERHEYVDSSATIDKLLASPAPPHAAFTYEGWAAVFFAQQFVQANEARLRALPRVVE